MKSLLALIGFGVVAYVFVFVPLGSQTAFQHCQAIAATDEAQELRREAGAAAERLEEHVEGEWARIQDGGPPDAGPPAEPPPRD